MTAADVMTGDATHDRTLDAALRVSSRGRNGQCERDGNTYHDPGHQFLPSPSQVERKMASGDPQSRRLLLGIGCKAEQPGAALVGLR
jgi:hypothetical protein